MLFLQISEWFLRRGERGLFMLSVIACFGAGAFLGAYMLHLVPEVDHLLHEFWLDPSGIDYPMAQLLVGLGFFLLVFIEQGIHALNDRMDKKAASNQDSPTFDIAVVENGKGQQNPGCQETAMGVDSTASECGVQPASSKPMAHVNSVASIATIDSCADLVEEEENRGEKMGAMKAVVLFVALSSDCVFEGLSLGLQSSEAGVWNLVIAILSHEVVISFMLGLELLKHYRPRQVFWLGFAYAMMNPVGIATGTAIHAFVGGDDVFEVVSGVLQALCGGVFIYVTFIEILAREFVGSNSVIKTGAVFAGFIMMALLALVPTGALEDGHGDLVDATTTATTAMSEFLTTVASWTDWTQLMQVRCLDLDF